VIFGAACTSGDESRPASGASPMSSWCPAGLRWRNVRPSLTFFRGTSHLSPLLSRARSLETLACA